MTPDRDAILHALERVIDPELKRPVTELDMVRDVVVSPDGAVAVTIALTVAGCPLRSSFQDQVARHVGSVAGGWASSKQIQSGRTPNAARKTTMLLCAFAVVPIVFAQFIGNLWGAVAIICLAAAAHLLSRGETPMVLEAGDTVGASIRAWGHVRLFSPWRYVVDPVSAAMLAAAGWTSPPPDDLPTGADLVNDYLVPLATLPAMAPHIRPGTRVLSVSRQGFDKLRTEGREAAPFVLRRYV